MLLNMSINSYVYHQFLIILISNTRMGSSRSLSKEWKIINRMPQTSKIANNKDIFHRSKSFPFKIAGDCSRIYFSIRGSRAHLLRNASYAVFDDSLTLWVTIVDFVLQYLFLPEAVQNRGQAQAP